mmetsp:Transcript_133901/g.317455  ORF Transcript_133901/g.317455 Transcript_133901/m.317455 type:complete len:221 (-) Transcript_133901:93-755(-)
MQAPLLLRSRRLLCPSVPVGVALLDERLNFLVHTLRHWPNHAVHPFTICFKKGWHTSPNIATFNEAIVRGTSFLLEAQVTLAAVVTVQSQGDCVIRCTPDRDVQACSRPVHAARRSGAYIVTFLQDTISSSANVDMNAIIAVSRNDTFDTFTFFEVRHLPFVHDSSFLSSQVLVHFHEDIQSHGMNLPFCPLRMPPGCLLSQQGKRAAAQAPGTGSEEGP